MKRWYLLSVFFLSGAYVIAQNTLFFGHYMFNPTYLNPAWGGSEGQGFVVLQHRTQWLGYNSSFDGPGGAPQSQMLTGIVPVENFFVSSVGLLLSNDNLGPINTIQVQFPISYTRDLRKGTISLGVAPSMQSQTLKFDELRFNDITDPLNIGRRETQTRPDFSAGLFFQSYNSFYFGLSAVHLLQPGFDFGLDSLENKQEMTFALNGGYTFPLNDEMSVSPTVLIRSNLRGITYDLGGILTLTPKVWTGLSYRRAESFILYLGYSLLPENRLKVGYSFDYIIQNRSAKAGTSHEIFLRYNLPDLVFGGKKSVKTPRFTF